jgi:hypothetical protein
MVRKQQELEEARFFERTRCVGHPRLLRLQNA